jgi:DNA-binding response OmpR family regulator
LAPSSTTGARILLVDDDRDLLLLLARRLALAGLAPVPAFSAPAAIQQFERDGADLVVLDAELGRWSGLKLVEELRQRTQVPILILTGCASHDVEIRSFELGADDYLQKPISTGSLFARIRAVLRRSRLGQEQAEVHVQLNAALRELVDLRDQALVEARHTARDRNEALLVQRTSFWSR